LRQRLDRKKSAPIDSGSLYKTAHISRIGAITLRPIEIIASAITGHLVLRNVRFGSKADMCGAKRYVRFAPVSDRESRHPETVMSALPPKADMCSRPEHSQIKTALRHLVRSRAARAC
jgi:hypothetical protein